MDKILGAFEILFIIVIGVILYVPFLILALTDKDFSFKEFNEDYWSGPGIALIAIFLFPIIIILSIVIPIVIYIVKHYL